MQVMPPGFAVSICAKPDPAIRIFDFISTSCMLWIGCMLTEPFAVTIPFFALGALYHAVW